MEPTQLFTNSTPMPMATTTNTALNLLCIPISLNNLRRTDRRITRTLS